MEVCKETISRTTPSSKLGVTGGGGGERGGGALHETIKRGGATPSPVDPPPQAISVFALLKSGTT